MADATIRKLVDLLKPDAASELRQAAALVLGEVGTREEPLTQALCDALNDPEPAVRLPVLRTIGRLKIERALPRLLETVSRGGPEAEVAAEAAASLGTKGTKALRELMHGAAPGLRRRIAAALGAGGSASADTAALNALLDTDPGVVDAAARTLIAKVPSLDARHRRSLADYTLDVLKDRKAERRPASEAALLRLLAALGDARGEAVFWAHTEPAVSAELRATALQALGNLPPPTARPKIQRLLECA
ncbi:MAG TPA: HEAT repeat domain-containing protein, partial [Gemmataceae bacterium]|nr:HEAT repeat domain-containing protein [Gemmataceae bacterium]